METLGIAYLLVEKRGLHPSDQRPDASTHR
jgi:hypothetical protein